MFTTFIKIIIVLQVLSLFYNGGILIAEPQGEVTKITGKQEMDQSYRQWLQSQANNGGQLSDALLQVVGDDGRLNDLWTSNKLNQVGYGDPNQGGYLFGVDQLQEGNAEMWDKYNALRSGGATPTPANNTTTNTAAAQKAAQDAATRSRVEQAKGNAYTGANENIDTFSRNQSNSILDWIESMGQQQEGVNTQRANAQLGFNNAGRSILDMIGRGMRSASTMLSNRNAGSSSAGEAIARAYGDLGQSKMSDAGNQFAMANANIDTTQNALNTARDSGKRKFALDQQNTVDSILSDFRNSMASLNDTLIGASLPDRINIEAEKENIRNQILAKLSGLTNQVNQVDQRTTPFSKEQIIQKAGDLQRAGTNTGMQFNVGDMTSQLQGGPQLSQIPLYSFTKKRF
jgi:hypothetical protein